MTSPADAQKLLFRQLTPDNGLLSLVFNDEKDFRVFEVTNENFFKHPISRTFHGRDIFAPVAAWLSNRVNPNDFGREVEDFVKFEYSTPQKISDSEIEAEIIHIDHFGNLITNLKQTDLPERFSLQINEKIIDQNYNYYSEANLSEIFTIIGSVGFLEIVAFKDSAKKLLNAQIGQRIILKL